MKKLILIPFILIFIGCNSSTIQKKKIDYQFENAESVLPKPTGLVNDFSHVFTENERKNLELYLTEYERKTTNQIAIVTIDNIFPYSDIADFAKDLGNYWRLGTAEKNNGLLIVLSMNDRQIRISTGTGTQEILSDKFLKNVIDQEITPGFKEEKFYDGIMKGLKEIIQNWSLQCNKIIENGILTNSGNRRTI